jgi:hypothetical protein
MKKVVFGVVCAVLAAGVAFADGPQLGDLSKPLVEQSIELGPLRTAPTVDRGTLKAENAKLHAWLMAEQVAAGIESPLEVRLSSRDLADIEFGALDRSREGPEALRVGVVKPLGVFFALDDVSFGAIARAPEGGRIWSAAIRSEDAFGLRIHFDNFWLPPDTELYLFNERGMVAGPYTGAGPFDTGEFWSNMIMGESAYLQLRQFGPAGNVKLHQTYFDVVEVGHVGRQMGASLDAFTKTFCDYTASCVENAECPATPSVVDVARNAVAHMQYVKRPYLYVCSGGLLNNSTGDGTPYFLTANHCISRDREAGTLETYFQWTVPCGDDCPTQWADPVDVPSMLGSSVVVTNRTSDFTLLLLDGQVESGVDFLGWSTNAVAYSNGAMLYRISHPAAAPQAYSSHEVDTAAGTCTSWPRGAWIYSRDVFGATQGGSSGSPVVNSQGLVVGQLSGACGTNLNDDCDAINNATVDGAFASYYSQVAPYLNPSGCGDVDGDGYADASCGGTDCDDNDPDVNPGAEEICGDGIDNNCDGSIDEGCVSCPDADEDGYTDAACGGVDCDDTDPLVNPGASEACDDGIDNDCDGFVDGFDSDCQLCVPTGEPCTSNAACCSGRCHPRKLTCK